MKKEKVKKSFNSGITLLALVITIIILIILASISISMVLRNNGLLIKAKIASDETKKSQATETMNLKITNIQISNYTETQELPNLQYLADKLCEDNDMEYVLTASKRHASLDKIDVTNFSSIFTKLKAYPYEFEIDSSLRLASIDGVKIADETKIPEGYIKKPTASIDITENGEYDVTNYATANISVEANMSIQYNDLKISYDDNSKSLKYFYKNNEILPIYWHGLETNLTETMTTWWESNSSATITKNDSTVTLNRSYSSGNYAFGGILTSFKIDLSKYSKLHFIINNSSTDIFPQYVSYTGNRGTDWSSNERNYITTLEKVTDEPKEYTVDISSITGTYYIGFSTKGGTGTYEIAAWWLE